MKKAEFRKLTAEEYATCKYDCPVEKCIQIHRNHRNHKNKSCRMYKKC